MKDVLSYGDKGNRVLALQRMLAGNRYANFRPGPVDGDFGPRTAAAVQKAKLLLGYSRSQLKPVAGQPLFEYLSGRKPLSLAMKARRKIRLDRRRKRRHSQSKMTKMRIKALAIINGEIGTMESGGHSNVIQYNSWWGWGAVPYCVIGISWAWVKAGSTAFIRGSRWAGTDPMLADAKAGTKGITLESNPVAGCPGVIDFDGHSDPDHAITFVSWKDGSHSVAITAEFNTVGKNGMEGVWYKERPARQCWFFEVLK